MFLLGMFDAIEAGPEAAEELVRQWESEVRAQVPEDKLLVFDVRDGYGPLCEFLGVEMAGCEMAGGEVAGGEFPRVNDAKSYMARTAKSQREAQMLVFGIPFVLLTLFTVIAAFLMLMVFKNYS